MRDRDRHLAETVIYSGQALNFTQQKLPEGIHYHHVDITVISYDGAYESTPVGGSISLSTPDSVQDTPNENILSAFRKVAS